MTQLTLGPLAFHYPKNMLVYMSLNVPLGFAKYTNIKNHSANLKNEIKDDIKVSTTTSELY